MRSAMPSTSGSSEEIIRTATPCAASSERSRCTSALVPTSMPRVGSSTIRATGCGRAISPAPPSAGCRPRASRPGSSAFAYFKRSRRAQSFAKLRSKLRRISPPRRTRVERGERDVALDREIHHEALLAPVLGDETDAGCHRCRRRARRAAVCRRSRPIRHPSGRSRRSPARPPSDRRRRGQRARRSRRSDDEGDVGELALACQAIDLQDDAARLRRDLGEQRIHVAADHGPDHRLGWSTPRSASSRRAGRRASP